LRLVLLNARIGVETVQLSERERDYYAVNSTAWCGNECGTLADPNGKPVDGGQLGALRIQPLTTQEFLIHEQPIEEDVGVS